MALQNKIPLLADAAIASYDFFEFSSSIGYKTFNILSVSGLKVLSTDALYSATGEADNTPYILGNAAAIDEDIDFQFRSPVTLEGDVLVNLSVTGDNQSGTQSVTTTITVTVYHFDGTTETQIGQGLRYCDFGSLGAGANDKKTVSLSIPITETDFKENEYIRVNIAATSPGANRRIFIITDPGNRTDIPYGSSDTVDFANSKIVLPFKVRR